MGFFCGIFHNGNAMRLHCGHHYVDGRPDADYVKVYVCAQQAAGLGADHAAVNGDLCTQRVEALEMLVDGANTEVAAARHRNICLIAAPEQRAQKIIGRPHRPGKFVRNLVAVHCGSINFEGIAGDTACFCAEMG
ncbi:hypothetical protein SDC9_163427 [bioreactor metagenome]|uniref:Uncharacterized protein n=1 Tax=bioreactor metagenome TaxID=1076179 RepID=A0A645FRP6_9ZZZZ